MSIIRATRQKGGSTFPLTSHVSLFFIRSSFGTHLATKPRACFQTKRKAGETTTHIMEKSKISGKDFQPYGQVFACRFFYAP